MGNWISDSANQDVTVAALSAAPFHLCPTKTPYFDGNNCKACSEEWPFF
jgi:hypothetical protein